MPEADLALPTAPTSPAEAQPLSDQTTLDERGQSPEGASSQTEPEVAAPKPKLKDLLADQDYQREYDGMIGERLRRERLAAAEEARREDAAKRSRELAGFEQQQIQREVELRQWEDTQMEQMARAGDFRLDEFTTQAMERRRQVDAQWKASQAERQRNLELGKALEDGRGQEARIWQQALEIEFRALPKQVQERLAGRKYEGETHAQARAAFWADVRTETLAFEREQWEAKLEREVESRVKSRLGKAYIAEPRLDLGGGTPVHDTRFAFMEDAEAALRAGQISSAEMREIRQRGLAYRRGR